ncbi:uncharacterized protein M421DRAFT_423065, partial [Didymella exigua CBS 183.55]
MHADAGPGKHAASQSSPRGNHKRQTEGSLRSKVRSVLYLNARPRRAALYTINNSL